MKQIWPTYAYSPTTNVLTLTGLNIDRDQLLLVTAADRGRIMYNFADSSVTASAFTSGANTALTLVATTAGLTTTAALVIYYDDQLASNSVTISSLPAIFADPSGFTTVVAGISDVEVNTIRSVLWIPQENGSDGEMLSQTNPLPISGTVTIGSALPAGTNRIGVVTIGGGTVTIGAGTAQIGSVTVGNATTSSAVFVKICGERTGAGPNETREIQTDDGGFLYAVLADPSSPNAKAVIYDPVEGNAYVSVRQTASVTIGSLPALVAGTAQIGSVTVGNTVTIAGTVTANPTGTQTIAGSVTLGASTSQIGAVTASISNSVTIGSLPAISGTVTANLSISSTVITSGSFTSLTSATIVPANTARKMATVYNLGAGQLFVNAGASATTLGGGFMVALSSGDFYECDYTTTTLSAIFATAGTASWVSH